MPSSIALRSSTVLAMRLLTHMPSEVSSKSTTCALAFARGCTKWNLVSPAEREASRFLHAFRTHAVHKQSRPASRTGIDTTLYFTIFVKRWEKLQQEGQRTQRHELVRIADAPPTIFLRGRRGQVVCCHASGGSKGRALGSFCLRIVSSAYSFQKTPATLHGVIYFILFIFIY